MSKSSIFANVSFLVGVLVSVVMGCGVAPETQGQSQEIPAASNILNPRSGSTPEVQGESQVVQAVNDILNSRSDGTPEAQGESQETAAANDILNPRSGIRVYESLSALKLKGATVNLANGNLHIERTDLSLKTLIGEFEIGAVYNSADSLWRWGFDLDYKKGSFRDFSGAWHSTANLKNEEDIEGTVWIKHSDTAMRTKGGLVYEFKKTVLDNIHWLHQPYPRVEFVREQGVDQSSTIRECEASNVCEDVFYIAYDDDNVVNITDRAGRSHTFVYNTVVI
jgi:hypothetical protein